MNCKLDTCILTYWLTLLVYELVSFFFVFLSKFVSIWTWSTRLWSWFLVRAFHVFFLFLCVNWVGVHEYTWIHFQSHSSLNHGFPLSRHFYLILNLKLIFGRWPFLKSCGLAFKIDLAGIIADLLATFHSYWDLLVLVKVSQVASHL